MLKTYTAILAITLTNALLQAGHGALNALMIRQGENLEFSATVLGFLISFTYVGFLFSNVISRHLLPRISFIRTFAICAAAISCLALLMPLFPTYVVWIGLRVLYGVFFCVAIIVCDSWLNHSATNENRSKLWGAFMTANYLSFGAGQYILVIDDSQTAFIVTAFFLIACLVPICLTRVPEPQIAPQESAAMRWRDAYAIAPVAFIGQFCFGTYVGATFLFINYLDVLDIGVAEQSTLAALFFGLGFIMQIPVGMLSDKIKDRRDVIIGVAAISCFCSLVLGLGGLLPYALLTLFIALLGSLSSTLFSLNIAYGQDFVEKEKSSAYAGILMRIYALGALLGPPVAGFLMNTISPNMLFWFSAFIWGGITLMAATNRLMPRYRSAKTEQFRFVSPLTSTVPVDDVTYTEIDIGPEIPDDLLSPSAPPSQPADIGPDAPNDAENNTATPEQN